MNENIDLTKILKGCEGIELYSSISGEVKFCYIKLFSNYPIRCIDKYNNEVSFTIKGKYINDNMGECLLFPSKDQRDWSKFVPPLIKDTPVLCCNDAVCWKVMHYKGVNPKGQHEVYYPNVINSERVFKYIIPYDKFDPLNISKSLQYNIQK